MQHFVAWLFGRSPLPLDEIAMGHVAAVSPATHAGHTTFTDMGSDAASSHVPLARQLQPAVLPRDDGSSLEPLRKAAMRAKRMLLAGDKRGAVEILRAITDACLVNIRLFDLCSDPDRVYEVLDCHLEALWAEAINDPDEKDPPEIEYWEDDADDALAQEDARRLVNAMDLPEWPLPTLARTPG